jgi:hypothetical protein
MEREFEMMHGLELRDFTAVFSFETWVDCFDSMDSRSEFVDWEYTLEELYYTTEEGEQIQVDHDLLRPEYKDLVESEINAAIENEVL